MSERLYMLAVGVLLLAGLYTDSSLVIYGIIAILILEGLTNYRVCRLFEIYLKLDSFSSDYAYITAPVNESPTFNIEAERMWYLIVGLLLLLSYQLYDMLWFLPWFMGFTIFGSGLSGVCPLLLSLRWAGFR
ncbi:MAG: hypothetical protein OQL09_03090 [Gammaproteobacteria bacterium]|nr:hypothetical protein [Gammaproteobacteria bacterium]